MEKKEKENFKTILSDKIIPMVKNMITQEEKHLVFLNNALVTTPTNTSYIQACIDFSQNQINHFKLRLEEYKNYKLE